MLERQIPVVSGFGSVLSNVGETKNKGIEISLSSLNINTKSFQWTTDVMFYANKESIESLYNGKVDDIGNKWFIGHPINVHYDYEKIGIWQNTPEDLAEMEEFNKNGANFKPGDIKIWDNGDKKITEADQLERKFSFFIKASSLTRHANATDGKATHLCPSAKREEPS